MAPAALARVLLPLLAAAVLARGQEADVPYRYRGYLTTMSYFEKLKREYPDLVETWIAQEAFPEILPSHQVWGTCEGVPCQTLVVRIANKRTLTSTTPEVFFSGALHGDERIGPLVVTELAGFLCRQYRAGNEEVRRLLDGRATWITPMTNAEGYANDHREENGIDPNRDFPYLKTPARCMQTQTARTVNELFRRHLFQFMITFHGGMRALTYEWGSRNHMKDGKSTESPDDRAFRMVGQQLQAAAGRDSSGVQWYPLGKINDLVYYVDGGLEDWSYAAGWEGSPNPITVCNPEEYAGYDPARTEYAPGSVATLDYLAEMDDYKTAPTESLGSTSEVWGQAEWHGHVARNMRMCLKLIELARPELVVHQPDWPSELVQYQQIRLQVHGFGCIHVSFPRLLLVPRGENGTCTWMETAAADEQGRQQLLAAAVKVGELTGTQRCRGLTTWMDAAGGEQRILHLVGRVPGNLTGAFCALAAAEFDQDWRFQSEPDPALPPRAHATRTRLEEHYTAAATEGSMRIDEFRTKLFLVRAEPVMISVGSANSKEAGVLLSTLPPKPTSLAEGTVQSSGLSAVEALSTAGSTAAHRVSVASRTSQTVGRPGWPLAVFACVLVVLFLCNGAEFWRLARAHVCRARRVPVEGTADAEAAERELEQLGGRQEV